MKCTNFMCHAVNMFPYFYFDAARKYCTFEQMNLVASGASESEIFIWDLNSPDKPMTPGAKAQV